MPAEEVRQLLVDPRIDDLLRRAPSAHLAMDTGKGPHVTPELFAWSGGRLWFATARRTLKARKLTAGAQVGLYIHRGGEALLLRAEARPIDALRPKTLLDSASETALFPAAGTTFVIRNAPHLAGFVAQGPWAWPRSASTLRMFIALRPIAVALIRNDRILEAAGDWASGKPRGRRLARAGTVRAGGLPDELSRWAEDFVPNAVVGLASPTGPVALPASWDGERATATVAGELLALAGVRSEGAAAVEVERMTGYAMEGKRGVLLRGRGVVTIEGDWGRIVVEPERATYWQGMETETVPASTS